MQGHTVRLEQQVLQGVDSLQTEGLLDAVRQVGVVEYHVEAERLGSQRHRGPDPTYGEQTNISLRGFDFWLNVQCIELSGSLVVVHVDIYERRLKSLRET